MSLADELWEKHKIFDNDGCEYVGPLSFRDAIQAAMEAVRRRDVEICETYTVDDVLVGVPIGQSCAAAIRTRPLP